MVLNNFYIPESHLKSVIKKADEMLRLSRMNEENIKLFTNAFKANTLTDEVENLEKLVPPAVVNRQRLAAATTTAELFKQTQTMATQQLDHAFNVQRWNNFYFGYQKTRFYTFDNGCV